VSPTSGTESTQPSTPQQPEQQQAQEPTEIPAGWKAKKRSQVVLKNNKGTPITYRVSNNGNWVTPSPSNEKITNKDLISALNLEAYKIEWRSKQNQQAGEPNVPQQQPIQPSSQQQQTAPFEPEDQETEEVQRQPQQTSQINFKELWDQVHEKQGNADEFVKAVSNFLLNDKTYSESYNQQLQQLQIAIEEKFKEIQSKKKLQDRVKGAAEFASRFVAEQKQINEVIDPVTGLAILVGSITVGGLYGVYKKNKNVQEVWNTPEGQYLYLLGLYAKIIHLYNYLRYPNANIIEQFVNDHIIDKLNNYNKFNINPFNKTNLLNKLKEQVKGAFGFLIQEIAHKSGNQSSSINESTIKRWKLLANIK
jgi:hypothetical protein